MSFLSVDCDLILLCLREMFFTKPYTLQNCSLSHRPLVIEGSKAEVISQP